MGDTKKVISNMLRLAGSTAAAKLFSFLTMPLITRLYTPDEFGDLSFFLSLVSILVPFATLRYSLAIPLVKNDLLAINLFYACLFIIIFVVTLFTIILSIIVSTDYLPTNSLHENWVLLILAIILLAIFEVYNFWALRKNVFNVIANTKMLQSFTGDLIKLYFGYLGFNSIGLIIGSIIYQSGGFLIYIKIFFEDIIKNMKRIRLKKILFILKHYSDIPKYRLPSQILLVFSMHSSILYFQAVYDSKTTGQLGLALMATALPITLLGHTSGEAYYAEISRLGRRRASDIYELTKKISLKLFFLSLIPIFILHFFGPSLFILFFGHEWELAGQFSSHLSLYLLTQFISTPFVNVFNVLGQQNIFFRINLIRFLVLFAVFYFSFTLDLSSESTIQLYSYLLSTVYLYTSFIIRKSLKLQIKNNLKGG